MRLTQALCFRGFRQRFYEKTAKIFWRTKGKRMFVRELRVTDDAKERLEGIEVEDTFSTTRYREALLREIDHIDDSWQPPVNLEQFLPKEELREEVLSFVPKSLFALGTRQAAVLSKSLVVHGSLPELRGEDLVLPEGAADVLKHAVMRANVWASDEDRLPRRFVPELPIWTPKPEYGILPKNQVRYLLTDLLRFAHLISRPSGLPNRLTVRDVLLPSACRIADQQLHFEGALEMAVFGRRPLPLLASPEVLETAETSTLPSLGPVSPLADLKTSRKYTPVGAGSKVPDNFQHLHLGVVNLSDLPFKWNYFAEPEAFYAEQDQKNAIGIMSAFGLALASAQEQSLIDANGVLKQPVTSQVVCCDAVNFDFVQFQLNTLDLESTSGPKNVAWLDAGHALFRKNIPRRARLRNTTYHDLDMDVFRRLVAAFQFGAMKK